MSWSVGFVGKVEQVVNALEAYSSGLTGLSKEEYDAALPSIVALVKLNMNPAYPPTIRVEASGHGTKDMKTGEMTQSQCMVTVKSESVRVV